MTEAVGWLSSAILFITVSRQIYKQWKEKTGEGVSLWLFIGQFSASVGFAVYSWLVWNPVFIFTNTLMALNALVGLAISLYLKKHGGTNDEKSESR